MTEARGPRRLLGLRRGSGDPSHGNKPQRQSKLAPRLAARTSPVQDELDDAPMLSPGSPGTPPPKTWERQYRTFLSRKEKDMPVPPVLPPPPPSGGATVALLKQKQAQQQGSPQKVRSESSVRGGKLFGQMFRNNSSSTANAIITPPVRRRVKSLSADDLGGTMRKGVERGKPSPPTMSATMRCVSVDALNHFGPSAPLRPRIETEENSSDDWMLTTDSERSEAEDGSLVHQIMKANAVNSQSFLVLQQHRYPDGCVNGVKLETESAIKKAFTEFHNSQESGSDAFSAYLGDDSSLRDNDIFYQIPHKFTRSVSVTGSMPQVREGVPQTFGEERVLRPVVGTDKWQAGRRYLIGPAALATCHESVAGSLAADHASPAVTATDDTSRFGTVVLGNCHMCYGGPERNADDQMWSSAKLVLRQNYILEFDVNGGTVPRGYAHLQYAVAYPHAHFRDMMELHFYGSPCAKSDKRILLIRLQDADQVGAWRTLLNRAASLTLEDIYDIQPGILGKGQYSTVHKAIRRGGSTKEVAVKLFDKNQFWRLVQKGVERADTITREIAVQATLTRRRNDLYSFIHLHGFFETSDHIIMEMELLDGTDLFKHISSRGVLPEPEAARILAELLRVIVAMNEVGLSHRDIKPANVLMCKYSPSEPHIKLCDFGMATFAGTDGLVRGRCGTPGYVAPEIFTAGLHGGYGNKVDIFSCGVTLYVMLCGYEPFYGTSDEELIEANRNAELEFPKEEWSTVSQQAINLVKSMMSVDPERRPSASRVLSDPWILKHTQPVVPPPARENMADSCLIL
mmetsp:Transcript_3069/g.6252  ORF Transcript_3069/g.6252 Transcript_3069/m.6252 type:complete len:798 (-) Transcript_3069:180-2573(-)